MGERPVRHGEGVRRRGDRQEQRETRDRTEPARHGEERRQHGGREHPRDDEAQAGDVGEGEHGPGEDRVPGPVAEVGGRRLEVLPRGEALDLPLAVVAGGQPRPAGREVPQAARVVRRRDAVPEFGALGEAVGGAAHPVGTVGGAVVAGLDGLGEVLDDRLVRDGLGAHEQDEEHDLQGDEPRDGLGGEPQHAVHRRAARSWRTSTSGAGRTPSSSVSGLGYSR